MNPRALPRFFAVVGAVLLVGVDRSAWAQYSVVEEPIRVLYETPAEDEDARTLLDAALTGCGEVAERLGVPLSAPLTVELMPSVEAFRERTGKGPYFAAAYLAGTLVVQPLRRMLAEGTLNARLRHECFHHLLFQTYPGGGFPFWLEEGLAALWFGPVPVLSADDRLDPRLMKRPGLVERWYREALTPRRHDQLYLLCRDLAARLLLHFGEQRIVSWLRDGSLAWRATALWKQTRSVAGDPATGKERP